VDGSHGPILFVDEEHGQAVCSPDNEEESGDVRHQGVTLELPTGDGFQAVDKIRVELTHDHGVHAARGRERKEIGLAPSGGAEAVHEPGDSLPARDREEAPPRISHDPIY
jgi:hypothetical protein